VILGTTLLLLGIFFSAFFSGSETGFYRVSRVRLVLDGLQGDFLSRSLLWLTNNPSLFVATTLVGNNVANYVTSLAIVLLTQELLTGEASQLFELLFVYGELFPKNVFYHRPNALLRTGSPLFLVCGILFSPVAALLWSLGRVLELALGQSPTKVALQLARKELQEMLEAGHEAGILRPSQRRLAQRLFEIAGEPVVRFCTPPARFPTIDAGSQRSDAVALARRLQTPVVAVAKRQNNERQLIGYVSTIDLALQIGDTVTEYRPIVDISDRATHISALMQLETAEGQLARLIDSSGKAVGLVTARRLAEPMMVSS